MIVDTEAQQRTMLRLSLDPDAKTREPLLLRQGRAIGWIEEALAPLRAQMSDAELRRLVLAVRSATGIEALVWLTDIAGLSRPEAVELMRWSAGALLRGARRFRHCRCVGRVRAGLRRRTAAAPSPAPRSRAPRIRRRRSPPAPARALPPAFGATVTSASISPGTSSAGDRTGSSGPPALPMTEGGRPGGATQTGQGAHHHAHQSVPRVPPCVLPLPLCIPRPWWGTCRLTHG